jgi:hypothetical protein
MDTCTCVSAVRWCTLEVAAAAVGAPRCALALAQTFAPAPQHIMPFFCCIASLRVYVGVKRLLCLFLIWHVRGLSRAGGQGRVCASLSSQALHAIFRRVRLDSAAPRARQHRRHRQVSTAALSKLGSNASRLCMQRSRTWIWYIHASGRRSDTHLKTSGQNGARDVARQRTGCWR